MGRHSLLLLALLGSTVAACSGNNNGNTFAPEDSGTNTADVGTATDRGNSTDTPRADAGSLDAASDATAGDATPPGDRPAGNPDAGGTSCSDPIDLNTVGTLSGQTTRITRNNDNATEANAFTGSCGEPGFQMVFRYTARANGRLIVSTNNPGSGELDTVVIAQSTCGTESSELGCNDDVESEDKKGSLLSTLTTDAVTAGQTVFIIVGGYLGSGGDTDGAHGTFELSVREDTPIAAGAACTAGASGERCADMTACLPTSASAATCAMSTPETEPNNTPMAPQAAVTGGRVYAGSVEEAGQDCYAITVAQGGRIYAEVSLPATPSCPSSGPDTQLTLYGPTGTELADNDDAPGRGYCSTIDPSTETAASNLAAGTYTVCVSELNDDAVPGYLLSLATY